jgi:hypothetical protein
MCTTNGETRNVYKYWRGNLMQRDHLGDLNGAIIMNCILYKAGAKVWTGLHWLNRVSFEYSNEAWVPQKAGNFFTS